MEIRFGEFMIELELPHQVEVDQVRAVYTDGFLRVHMPKARPRHIPIAE
jgi:HSP20 family molecular chaperone IbpA